MSHSNKKLYNYIVNTIGISKELILQIVDKRMENLLDKHIKNKLDSNVVERIILDRVTEILTQDFSNSNSFYCKRESFETYLKKILQNIVNEKINKTFSVTVQVAPKTEPVDKAG